MAINWEEQYPSIYGNVNKVQGFNNSGAATFDGIPSFGNAGMDMGFGGQDVQRALLNNSGYNFSNNLDRTVLNPSGSGSGLGKYFIADNMNAFGSAISGLGQLASGWAALKNISLQRDAYDTMKDQWERNYGDQAKVTNNMIQRRNDWAAAQGMPTSDNYVG